MVRRGPSDHAVPSERHVLFCPLPLSGDEAARLLAPSASFVKTPLLPVPATRGGRLAALRCALQACLRATHRRVRMVVFWWWLWHDAAAAMQLHEYILLAFSSLFVIVDPIAAVPAFLAMTPRDTPAARVRMAGLACVVAGAVLMAFAATGEWIFRLLGITLPAFQMAGSIVLLLIALDMLRARRSAVHETAEETEAGTEKDDIAITPLAVPMLAGPGAITTALLLRSRADGLAQHVAFFLCIAAVCLVSYVILRVAAHGARWLSPIALKIATRLMGLLLAAVAMQFMFDALRELLPVNR